MKINDILYSIDEEYFYHESVQDALDAIDDLSTESVIWSGTILEIKPSHLFSIDDISEQMITTLYDEVGEFADDEEILTPSQWRELDCIIKDYLDTNGKLSCYKIGNVKKIEVTQEMIDGID